MTRSVQRVVPLVVVLATSAFVGCGESKPKLFPVSGTVTFDGRPVAEGVIYFKTVQTGAIERFDIEDGKFRGDAQAGERRVEICVYRQNSVMIDGEMTDVPENIVPPHYNLQSTLTAAVTPAGPNQFTFELSSR